jgi:hypothetical protein
MNSEWPERAGEPHTPVVTGSLRNRLRPQGIEAPRFSVLLSASNIPVASMIWLEGQSFNKFGTHGLLWTDAAANLLMFAIVAAVFATHGLGLRTVPASNAKPQLIP